MQPICQRPTYIVTNARYIPAANVSTPSPQQWGLFCPVFDIEVKPNEKACIYHDVKKK